MPLRLLLFPDAEGSGTIPGEARQDTTGMEAAQVGERADWNAPNGSTTDSADEAGSSGVAEQGASAGAGTATDASLPAASPSEWRGVREAAAALGYADLGQFQDDHSALQHLIQQAARAKQSDLYARIGQQLAPHAGQLLQQVQQQRAPAAPERKPWEAPEFDERWLQLVEQNPASGIYISKPGVAPEFAQKVNAYSEWMNNFHRNPGAMLDAYAEQKYSSVIDQRINERIAQREEQAAINQIQAANAGWLYQQDQAGQIALDYQGRPLPTPAGSRYLQILGDLHRAGVKGATNMDLYARQILRGELAAGQAQQPQATRQQAGNAQQRQVRNPLQALPNVQRDATPGATEPSGAGQSLAEMIRVNLRENGVTDDDIARSAEDYAAA